MLLTTDPGAGRADLIRLSGLDRDPGHAQHSDGGQEEAAFHGLPAGRRQPANQSQFAGPKPAGQYDPYWLKYNRDRLFCSNRTLRVKSPVGCPEQASAIDQLGLQKFGVEA